MSRLTIAALIVLYATSAQADVFTYICRLKGRSLPVKIDIF